MNDSFLRRWLTVLTLAVMVVAMAGYAGHRHGDAAHAQGSVQCDFCAAFPAMADAALSCPGPVAARPEVPLRLAAAQQAVVAVARAHPPRAPPFRT